MKIRELIIYLFILVVYNQTETIDLNGKWSLNQVGKPETYKGNVPGDVHTDLYLNKVIENPLYGDNPIKHQWIGRTDWIYTTEFILSKQQLQAKGKILNFDGIDTVSSVFLNGKTIITTNNMFLAYTVDVTYLLEEKNKLEVYLYSPVKYAQNQSDNYVKQFGHSVPPQCPPDLYNGECHMNMIRKAQYQFGWDWGPSIPTMGIWKSVQLHCIDAPLLKDISWTTKLINDFWEVRGDILYFKSADDYADICSISISSIYSKKIDVKLQYSTQIESKYPFKIRIPKDEVKLWWPNGEGSQSLYDLTVDCDSNQTLIKRIGFRTIELVQTFINENEPQQGRNFYFKINDRPIFLKGSNWIPATMFLASNYTVKMKYLLDSASEVGMNAIRVWGGGVYETEEFYEHANEKGILIWQDLMFACALYPVDTNFLSNVRKELRQQIWRIRKHPSILLYAGDNELETAIRSQWWPRSDFTEEHQVSDYLKLRLEAIKPVLTSVDHTRPFVFSSPSNGNYGETSVNIPLNPDDPTLGDIHNYNELVNQWHDNVYNIPRCVTEYGVQSLPFRETMLKHIPNEDWYYTSPNLYHRQHHPIGALTNLLLVYTHFPISDQCKGYNAKELHKCSYIRNGTSFLDRFAFFSQANQAIMYKVQTEHYRRYRNRLTSDGRGNTMCALYWQLNDVWAAPTWSSIDIEEQWKIAHYEARRFFNKIAVSLFTSSEFDIGLAIMNDTPDKIEEHVIKLKQFAWDNGFLPVYRKDYKVNVNAFSGIEVELSNNNYDSNYLYTASLYNINHTRIGYETVLFPDKLYEVDFSLFGDVSVISLSKQDDLTYAIRLEANSLSPMTWLSCVREIAWFSDNGFTMTNPRKTVYLHMRNPGTIDIEDIAVCNLKTCGVV